MSIANCPRCGKVFNKTAGASICQPCVDAEEEAFQKVYAFLKENLEATVPEIQYATDVEEKLILKFLEDGRLMGTGAKLSPKCHDCGAPIQMGRFCSNCLAKKRDAFTSQAKHLITKANAGPDAAQQQGKDVRHELRTDKYLK